MKNLFILLVLFNGLLISQTSSEIKKAKQMFERSGLSKSQAIKVAKAQGYSEKQIDAVIQKQKTGNESVIQSKNIPENQNYSIETRTTNNSIQDQSLGENKNSTLDKDEIIKFESIKVFPRKSLSHFGYDIFNKDPALFQEASLGVVDPNYLIGPGDEIIVMLWGETQFRQVLPVGREGFVFIPEVGQVFVNGLNLNLLESKLFKVFSQSYESLNPQGRNSTTFLDVSLGKLRPLRIQVLGEVSQPGAYTVSPSTTLFSSLYYFNGPTTKGSLRDIQLIRNGENISSIDFYDYLLTGRKPKDIKLRLDDVIFIPRRLKTVIIEGEINRTGIYELRENETLKDLIFIAGDLKMTAYLDRSQIDRIVPFEDRDDLGMDRMIVDVNLKNVLRNKEGYKISDGDQIKIFSIFSFRQNIVSLSGAIARPGNYDRGDSLKVEKLISNAGGLLGDAYLKKADLIRTKENLTEEIIELDLEKVMSLDPRYNINLNGMDVVKIYSVNEMIDEKYVEIEGHIKNRGRFPLHENMTLHDLIFMAGGFIDESFKEQAYLERADLVRLNDDGLSSTITNFNLRNILDAPKSKVDFLLKTKDIIRIHKKSIFLSPELVSISGVVQNEGDYNLWTNMTLKDLIIKAGGLKKSTYTCKVEVARVDPFNDVLNKYAEVIIFDMNGELEVLDHVPVKYEQNKLFNEMGEFMLKKHDFITLRPDPYFKNKRIINISGEVLFPGNYVVLYSGEKVTDIIERAGGVLPSAYLNGSQYIREGIAVNLSMEDLIKNPESMKNFEVRGGDKIIINSKPNIVSILGEVSKSGFQKYYPNKRLRYYLRLAGGLSPDADRANIWIESPNGTSHNYFAWAFFSPKVDDGSTIVVGKLKDKKPFDYTDFAKELTSITASIAQTIAVVFLASK